MNYIDADKLTAEIDDMINVLKLNANPNPMGTTEQCMAAAEIETLEVVKETIHDMKITSPKSL